MGLEDDSDSSSSNVVPWLGVLELQGSARYHICTWLQGRRSIAIPST